MGKKLLAVSVLSPQKVLFEGKADRVVLPGEFGVFEIQPFHKKLLSRLLSGTIIIDEKLIPIYRGVAQVGANSVTVIVEDKIK